MLRLRLSRHRLPAGGADHLWPKANPQCLWRLNREVTIKELRLEWAADRQIRERFVREARLMEQLAHRGSCPFTSLAKTSAARLRAFGKNEKSALFSAISVISSERSNTLLPLPTDPN
jgi:hypothetical protein